MKNITERQLQILEFLAEFKFLTASQVMTLLEVKTLPHVNQLLNKLHEGKSPLVKFKSFGFYPGAGRLARIHYLTKKGAEFLIENLEVNPDKIKLTKERTPLFQRDYFHRVETINFNIQLKKTCVNNGFEKVFFDYYFDKIGSNRNNTGETSKAKNALNVGDFQIIPDGIGRIKKGATDVLFLFEQHNGKDSGRAIKQIFNHMSAISEGSANEKYNYPKGVRVVYVFELESCKRAVIKELHGRTDIYDYKDYFLFKTSEEMKADFYSNWLLFSGEKIGFI